MTIEFSLKHYSLICLVVKRNMDSKVMEMLIGFKGEVFGAYENSSSRDYHDFYKNARLVVGNGDQLWKDVYVWTMDSLLSWIFLVCITPLVLMMLLLLHDLP